MAENALSAEVRTATGKGFARKLRAEGRIPGVVYGKGKPSESVVVDPRALETVLHSSGSGMNTLIDLDLAGQKRTVLVKELHRDPVRGSYMHADFYLVDLQQKITVTVPVHFEGKAKGAEFGGILEHPVRELEIECLPSDIPDSITADVSALEIGDSLHVRELTLPKGVELLSDAELAVAIVEAPTAEEEPEVAAEPAEGEAAPAEAGDKEKATEGEAGS